MVMLTHTRLLLRAVHGAMLRNSVDLDGRANSDWGDPLSTISDEDLLALYVLAPNSTQQALSRMGEGSVNALHVNVTTAVPSKRVTISVRSRLDFDEALVQVPATTEEHASQEYDCSCGQKEVCIHIIAAVLATAAQCCHHSAIPDHYFESGVPPQ